jgi:hypothetical protein
MNHPDLSPPWVLFCDKGKPFAIFPAGRPGEVANVKHLSMERAQKIVRLANELHEALVEASFERIDDAVQALASRVGDFGRQMKNIQPIFESDVVVIDSIQKIGEAEPEKGSPE